ncbi:hypothetical protein NXV35_11530 [Bacteroides faecis]|nr:hypothetical protein [Bacteroides faecis]
MNTINTIAPCGMNCALCYAFQDRKNLAPAAGVKWQKYAKIAETA